MGLIDRIASAFRSTETSYRVSLHSVFQGWMQQLAKHLGAHLEFDEDGDAEFTVHLGGEACTVFVFLKDGMERVYVPSNIRFASGELPGDVAAFLAERNKKLDYADWDAIDNGQQAYFTIEAHGKMDRISVNALQDVIGKMLVESAALDRSLQEQGYVC